MYTVVTQIEVTELTGTEQMIYANLEGQNFVGEIDSAKTVHPGDRMNLVF